MGDRLLDRDAVLVKLYAFVEEHTATVPDDVLVPLGLLADELAAPAKAVVVNVEGDDDEVIYWTTVHAEIDHNGDGGEVTGVHVDDENLRLVPGQDDLAVGVAESAVWPVWEFGW